MIDEKRLIKDIQNRINYWKNKAAEYDIAGYTERDICVEKAIELNAVLNLIKEQSGEEEMKNPFRPKQEIKRYGLRSICDDLRQAGCPGDNEKATTMVQ